MKKLRRMILVLFFLFVSVTLGYVLRSKNQAAPRSQSAPSFVPLAPILPVPRAVIPFAERPVATRRLLRPTDLLRPECPICLPGDLLKLPQARLELSTASGDDTATLAALLDDDLSTLGTAAATPDAPLNVVYGFDGRLVTVERLWVRLPDKPDADVARVELFASVLSPRAGFRLLSSEPLQVSGKPQIFVVPPTAARWVMLRFVPKAEASRVAIAEVAVIGHAGPPVMRYAFTEAPAPARDVLACLRSLHDIDTSLRADEVSLFTDAAGGKLNRWTLAEAALLASGVRNPVRREDLLQRIKELAAEVQQATATAKTPREKGEQLLRWMHAGPLAGGHRNDQNNLSVLLRQRTFNGVSSAVLYNILAEHLGLNVRAAETSGQVYSVLCDGERRTDVLTAIPHGFDPSADSTRVFEFIRRTGFRYVADSQRDHRREIDNVGLVALLWYHRGIELAWTRRYPEALGLFFRALSLDPGQHAAVQSMLNVLAFWSQELATVGEFNRALSVAVAGLELDPRHSLLRYSWQSAWINRALSMTPGEQDDAALAILREAASVLADPDFVRTQAWIFIRKADKLAEMGQWRAALTVLEPGFSCLRDEAATELANYLTGLYQRWAHAEMSARHFEKAVAVLAEGLRRIPDDRQLSRALAAVIEQWTAHASQVPGDAVLLVLLAELTDERVEVRTKAAEKLAMHKDKSAVEALTRALTDKEGIVRRAAADSLKKIDDRSAVPALKRRVADEVWVSPPDGFFTYSHQDVYDGLHGLGSKDHALATLRALAPEEVSAALREAAQSPNAKVRDWAKNESKSP